MSLRVLRLEGPGAGYQSRLWSWASTARYPPRTVSGGGRDSTRAWRRGAESQTPARQEKAAACVAMDIWRRDQMLLFLALPCQFIGGILGTHRKGRKVPESEFCPGQVACEPSGAWVPTPTL